MSCRKRKTHRVANAANAAPQPYSTSSLAISVQTQRPGVPIAWPKIVAVPERIHVTHLVYRPVELNYEAATLLGIVEFTYFAR